MNESSPFVHVGPHSAAISSCKRWWSEGKLRVPKSGGRGNYVWSWGKLPGCSKSAFLVFGCFRYHKCGPGGLRSFGSFTREDGKKWTQNTQLFSGHMCVKGMQKQNRKLSLALCGMWDHSPPETEMLVLPKFHHLGCYLKQEFSKETLNCQCPFRSPAWCQGHHLLTRQEPLQAQLKFCSVLWHFSPIFHSPHYR